MITNPRLETLGNWDVENKCEYCNWYTFLYFKNAYGCVWLSFVTPKFPPVSQVCLPCASQPSSAVSSLDTCTPTACSQRLWDPSGSLWTWPQIGSCLVSNHPWFAPILIPEGTTVPGDLGSHRGLPYVRDVTQRCEHQQLGSQWSHL